MAAQRCRAPRCGRFVRTGAEFCRQHASHDGDGGQAEDSRTAHERFLERLEQGEYEELIDEHYRRVIGQAATALSEHGLVDEIGALRIALRRVLVEDQDATRMAANVTRIAAAAVQAARAQRAITGDVAQGLSQAVTQILAELDAG